MLCRAALERRPNGSACAPSACQCTCTSGRDSTHRSLSYRPERPCESARRLLTARGQASEGMPRGCEKWAGLWAGAPWLMKTAPVWSEPPPVHAHWQAGEAHVLPLGRRFRLPAMAAEVLAWCRRSIPTPPADLPHLLNPRPRPFCARAYTGAVTNPLPGAPSTKATPHTHAHTHMRTP